MLAKEKEKLDNVISFSYLEHFQFQLAQLTTIHEHLGLPIAGIGLQAPTHSQ
jgi:hypothetical protein